MTGPIGSPLQVRPFVAPEQDGEPAVVWALEREAMRCEEVLQFSLEGDPASKSRARFTSRNYKSRTYTPEKTKQAERAVGWAARSAGASSLDATGTFGLMAVFFSATWQRRDVDNMLKLVSDALTGVVWKDDSQVTEMSARVIRADPHPRTHVLVYRTRGQARDERPCPICGTAVRSYRSVRYKTCSRACSTIAARSEDWTCRTCGETERRTPARAQLVYCDEACRRGDPDPRVRHADPDRPPYRRPAPAVHNASGYANGCRCAECRTAWNARNRRPREQ